MAYKEAGSKPDDMPIEKLRQQYLDYAFTKGDERNEQKESRRYYHGIQLTDSQLKILKQRRQAPVIKNEISRKINGVVGLLERLRQDPKAYARTPKHEDGADIATYCIRYVLDENNWTFMASEAAHEGATPGIGGVALELKPGDSGEPDDMDVGLTFVDSDYFFYDPRSFRPDFSDCRYMGEAKWVSEDVAAEMFPEKKDQITGMITGDGDFTLDDSDKDKNWVNTLQKSLRLVEHWYQKNGQWCWCFYSGALELDRGESPFFDNKGNSISRYLMFSGMVDQDGDRYGIVRNLRSAQDEVNARGAKAMHLLNARRIKYKKGSFANPEKARQEAARADGMIEWQGPDAPEFEDAKSQADMAAHLKFQEMAKAYIDNYGFNPSLVGTGVQDMSGRAIALQQQAGIAELGPFILSYKDWKLRVYRAVWAAIQRYWKAERFIRVTDDDQLAQYIEINGLGIDPNTNLPTIVNALGSLDVDIIMDEAPDSINMMADTHEALGKMIQSVGQMMAPPEISAAVKIFIDTSVLPASAKKEFRKAREMASQPDPMKEQAQQITLAGEHAKVKETESKVIKNITDAMKNAKEAMQPEPDGFQQRSMDRADQREQRGFDLNSQRESREFEAAQNALVSA